MKGNNNMKMTVDQETCIGCGLCATIAPMVFEMNDDGKAQAGMISEEQEQNALDALEQCPVEAIHII